MQRIINACFYFTSFHFGGSLNCLLRLFLMHKQLWNSVSQVSHYPRCFRCTLFWNYIYSYCYYVYEICVTFIPWTILIDSLVLLLLKRHKNGIDSSYPHFAYGACLFFSVYLICISFLFALSSFCSIFLAKYIIESVSWTFSGAKKNPNKNEKSRNRLCVSLHWRGAKLFNVESQHFILNATSILCMFAFLSAFLLLFLFFAGLHHSPIRPTSPPFKLLKWKSMIFVVFDSCHALADSVDYM